MNGNAYGLLYLCFLIIAVFVAGFFIGLLWRWRASPLFLICGALGFGFFEHLRSWSWADFSEALFADHNALQSYLIYFVIDFMLFGIPTIAGGILGFILRRAWPRLSRR